MMRLMPRATDAIAIVLLLALLAVPFLTADPFVYSVANQAAIGFTGAASVYLMMRMGLLTFAVPAFMAVGGYATAIAGLSYGVTDVAALTLISFAAPALLALPLGVLVLRLRGVYFVLVTFLLSEIAQLALFETPGLTGGANGLIGMPAVTLFGTEMSDNRAVLVFALAVAVLAAVITAAVVSYYRQHFAAIEENEVLAQSLGLVVWHYKVIGFVVAGGLAGMAGFSLVNMLLTAHPTSFGPASSIDFIAYAIVGGSFSLLGSLVGSGLLVWMSNVFSGQGQFSEGLFGLLLVVVVLGARSGIVGTLSLLLRRVRRGTGLPSPLQRRAAVAKNGRSG